MIQINGLKKKYKDFTLDLTLDLPKGRVSGLVGKNGAGKSTTLKAILGLIQTDEGSVEGLRQGCIQPYERGETTAGRCLIGFFVFRLFDRRCREKHIEEYVSLF